MGVNQKKLERLKSILSSGKRLLIFSHNNPDPDSLTSAFILSEIAKYFGLRSKVVYSGKIAYKKNLVMITNMKLQGYIYKLGEEKNFDIFALVDTQKGMTNNIIPDEIDPHLTFDHHPLVKLSTKKRSDKLNDIRTHYGSAATILLEYYLELGLKMTSKMATAYCYTLIAETNHFTQKYNKYDVRLYRKAVQSADLRIISKIESTKRPVAYFDVLKKVLSTYKQNNNLLTCALGEIVNLDFLHEIANFMLTMEGVSVVAITGRCAGIKKICCRSSHPGIHLGSLLRKSLREIGSGGGHEAMAAGEFRTNENQAILAFKSQIKKSLKK